MSSDQQQSRDNIYISYPLINIINADIYHHRTSYKGKFMPRAHRTVRFSALTYPFGREIRFCIYCKRSDSSGLSCYSKTNLEHHHHHHQLTLKRVDKCPNNKYMFSNDKYFYIVLIFLRVSIIT